MKTLSRIILGVALAAPVAVTSAVHADDKTPPAQPSPDKTSPDDTSPDKTSGDRKQDVTIDQLPKAVKATVQRETKGKNIASITKSTDSNGTAAYEIKVLDGTKETTIGVANNGKVTARKTGAASSNANPPGTNPTDATPPRANSPHATSPSAPPSSSPPPSAPPPSVSPPSANSPSATSPSAPPPSTDTPSTDKKQDQRPNPPGH
jgi:hypothetical protein